MRLRISRQTFGSVDGIELDGFRVGLVYDVGMHLACYLLAEQYAEPVEDSDPVVAIPSAQVRFDIAPSSTTPPQPQATTMFDRGMAADRGRPGERTRAKKPRP